MFRRLRYRKWIVTGLGLAALVVPTAALAGSNGLDGSWARYGVSLKQQDSFDGRNPDTVDAALAVNPKLDPAIVKYLERYGYSLSQIQAFARPARAQGSTAAPQKLDPAIVKYLERYGFTQSQIAAMSGGAYKATTQPKLDPAIVKYLERYGFTQSQIAAMSGGARQVSQKTPALTDGRSPDTVDFAGLAHSPVVTVTRSPGFQWDDFGIGLSAALLALIAVALTRVLSNRGGQKPVTSS